MIDIPKPKNERNFFFIKMNERLNKCVYRIDGKKSSQYYLRYVDKKNLKKNIYPF